MIAIALIVLVLGVVSTLLRGWVIDALKDAGIYEKVGEPRRIQYSDALFVRVLFVADGRIRAVHRVLFKLYFVASFFFILSILALILMTTFGHD